MSYWYSTLRFVPDPARAEAVNLGVVAGDDDSGDWDVRLVSGLRRAKAIDNEGRLSAAMAFIASLEEQVTGEECGLETEDLERLSQEMRNVVQLTRPAPIVAESASAALDVLFQELIVEPSGPAKAAKKWEAMRSTVDAYENHNVPRSAVARKAPVHSGPYTATFDFAVHNGSAVQLVQCWSFQLLGQYELADQVKSWAWVARALRADGGNVVTNGDLRGLSVDEDVEIAAVYLPPREGTQSQAFDEAQAAFSAAEVSLVSVDETDGLGQRAAERLGVSV